MTGPGSVPWFALHELRLAWRDWAWLLSGGRRRSTATVIVALGIFAAFMHGFAYLALPRAAEFAGPPDRRMLVMIGGAILLYGSLMLSQALEAVTRAFYARGDLDLVLSSPADTARLFAVRLGAMAVSTAGISLVLAAPAIDVVAWRSGARWLAAYGVMAALAMTAVALSSVVVMLLFALIGPRRTRLAAQVIAAVVGAGFVIGIQFLAILSIGTLSRVEFLRSDTVLAHVPQAGSLVWLPAWAASGDWPALVLTAAAGAALLAGAIALCAPRFGRLALAAAGMAEDVGRPGRPRRAFRPGSPAQALRGKEWALLRRDPWLMSQTLMQLLYLLPPFFLLWRSFYGGGRPASLLVPVLIMSAGQLAGGLAWLAVSGEDAPELIASAPVTPALVWKAKAEAVAGIMAIVFGPILAVLALIDPTVGLVGLAGIAISGAAATLIQFWFRKQVKRSLFRRRHVSSRIATFAEALSSITWSGAGAIALVQPSLAVMPAAAALAILAGAWLVSPARH
ncbi:MAG: permease [Alphaproteobacteria bacterium]|nr:permease [Alphaproteobacteria bacterium]